MSSNGHGTALAEMTNDAAALNFSRDRLHEHDLRYEMAGEFVDVVRGLWDTWDDGAVVADLYAGSGALGLEAISRGAERAIFVERDRSALVALRQNIQNLGVGEQCVVHAVDVLAWVPAMRGVDIAFIDPPYDFSGWDALLAVLDVPLVVAESDEPVVAPSGWEVVRTKRYGRTHVTTLERVG